MELIDSDEAAQILQVNKSRLHQLTRDGFIRAQLVKGANMYDPNEVHQLKDLRDEGTTLVDVAAMATRAQMIAYRLERRVTQLLNIIGADIPSADISPEAVSALHLQVEHALTTTTIPTVNDLMHWGQIFQSLSEEYFHIAAQEFETNEPWLPYLDLSNRLLRTVQRKRVKNDLEFSTAYNYLEMARRNMRQTMFFYVRSTSNKRIAHRAFPESLGDIHEDILSMVSLAAD
jgi:hypothetical protein